MNAHKLNGSALLRATLLGTLLQVGMVLGGHVAPAVAQLFAPLGISLSLVAGVAYVFWAAGAGEPPTGGAAAAGGAIAGGACALLGIALSVALGDVPPAVLGFGTASSAVGGALGGAAAARLLRRRMRTGAA